MRIALISKTMENFKGYQKSRHNIHQAKKSHLNSAGAVLIANFHKSESLHVLCILWENGMSHVMLFMLKGCMTCLDPPPNRTPCAISVFQSVLKVKSIRKNCLRSQHAFSGFSKGFSREHPLDNLNGQTDVSQKKSPRGALPYLMRWDVPLNRVSFCGKNYATGYCN